MKVALRNKKHSAFSLVEMLVVIAVIGVIAAIAVPNISKINRGARYAKDQRNAQQIASVVASANAAGHDFAAGASDEEDVADAVIAGHELTAAENPSLQGTYFGVPNLDTVERDGAVNFLTLEADGRVTYDADKVAPSTY